MQQFRAMGLLALSMAVPAALAAGCGDDGTGTGNSDDHQHADGGAHPSADMEFEPIPCPPEIEDITVGQQAAGMDGNYMAEIVSTSPAPPELYLNAWNVKILDMDGEAAADIEMTDAEAYMPAHMHDGAYPTFIAPGDDAGTFSVENINMWMGGPWEVRFWVEGPEGSDYIVFDVCVEE